MFSRRGAITAKVLALSADEFSMGALSTPKIYLLLETGGGGSGRHVLDLYSGLAAAGWDTHLLLSTTRMDAAFAEEVAALPKDRVTLLKLRRSPHVSDIPELRRIRRLLSADGRPYVLHAHSTKAAIVAWALSGRGPSVFTPHAYRGMDPNLAGYRGRMVRKAEQIFSRRFHTVIAVSEDEVTYAASLGVQSSRVQYIPNGVNADVIRALAGASAQNAPKQQRTIGFLGRLVDQKNPRLFLQVVQRLVQQGESVRALVLGDGPLRPELQALAQTLGIADRVEWPGLVSAMPYLAQMDVLLHTSAYESLPYALLEAVAASVPVVAVRNAGSQAIFGELSPQSIVPEGTPEALARVVRAALHQQQPWPAYRQQYTEIANRFSTHAMVRNTIAVYEDALRSSAQRAEAQTSRWLPRLFPSRLGVQVHRSLDAGSARP